MFYEKGNYKLAGNYFEKAIQALPPGVPEYENLLVNYKINIASLYIKLEELDNV